MKQQQALVLSGGGARGAYQVGVMCGLTEVLKKNNLPLSFDYYSGVSAGAINAALLASYADNFSEGCDRLRDLWTSLTSDQVFYTDIVHMGKIGLKWMGDLSFGGLKDTEAGKALLETTPLGELITSNLSFERIADNIKDGHLKALLITANDYKTSTAVTFVQGQKNLSKWNKARRMSWPATITTEHIMASSAIPLLFPPIGVDGVYYGDGCVRNSHPCAPSIYLGAERLFIVGVRNVDSMGKFDPTPMSKPPSLARVINVLLNSVLLDGIELDVERLERVNAFLKNIPTSVQEKMPYKPVKYVWISPSRDIGEMALQHSKKLPRILRYLLKGLGSIEDAREIVSYLLFEGAFCKDLIQLGYEDALAAEKQVLKSYED